MLRSLPGERSGHGNLVERVHLRLSPGSETLARRGWIEPQPSSKESREGADARREAWLLARRGSPGADDLDDDAP